MRIYQWLAVTSVVAGAMVTAVGRGAPAPEFQFEVAYILPALAFGGITWFAYGMDFPDVNRRFARLA